jgi:LysR family transcriptional regulator, hypochlorite-specific transcription factor HypT
MQLKWLEDLIAVAQVGSLAGAAQARHVTAPAFGRRIKALEVWLGAPVIERSAYPTRLTEVGAQFLVSVQEIVVMLETGQRLARAGKSSQQGVRIATGRTLGQTLFPPWLLSMQQKLGTFEVNMSSGSLHDALTQLEQNAVDLVFCYGHPCLPLALDAGRFERINITTECLIPVAAPNLTLGKKAIPFLALAPSLALGRIWAHQIPAPIKARLKTIYEADFAEPLVPLVKARLGVAWLPESLVAQDLKRGSLVQLNLSPAIAFDVQLIRANPVTHPWVEKIWQASQNN